MSTSPVVPAAVSAATTDLGKISAFLKKHERILIVLLCLAVGMHFYTKVINAWETHEGTVADVAHVTLQAAADKSAAIATVNQQATAQYQQLAAQLAQTNAALVAAEVTRDKATTIQQAADIKLQPAALAIRWTSLLSLPAPDVTTNADETAFTVKPEVAQQTVAKLDSIPGLTADLANEKSINANDVKQLGSLTALNSGLNTEVVDLKLQVVDAVDADVADKNQLNAQLTVAKNNKFKSKLKWLGIGVGIGYAAGIATSIALKF